MPKLVTFGFSANPPANHHLAIVQELIKIFEKIIVIPRGTDQNKLSTAATTHNQRRDMVSLMFSDLPNIEIDFSDLDGNTFTPTWMIDQKYKAKFPDLEIWHAAGGDLIKGGSEGHSEIQERWQKGLEIWTNLNWAIIDNPDCPIDFKDLPSKNIIVKIGKLSGRSTIVRNKVISNQPISDLVSPEIEKYIKDHELYKK